MRVCHMCHSGALCDERHILLECPALGDLRSQFAPLVAESSGVMAQLVWADDQPLVSKYIIACLDRSEVLWFVQTRHSHANQPQWLRA